MSMVLDRFLCQLHSQLLMQVGFANSKITSFICFLCVPAPRAAPVGLTAENVSSRAISLNWQPPPISSHNGVIQEYRLHVLETNTKNEIYYKSQSTKMTLDYLHPYYNYQISVAAVTVDVGPYATITARTLEEGKKWHVY